MKRRDFLQLSSLATGSLFLPEFLKAFDGSGRLPGGEKVLLVIQLSGGNDGLNTVIPVRDDIYYRARPGIGIAKEKALVLTGEMAFHPALTAFRDLYNEGSLAVLNEVGYPEPDRSHFRSMDIWQSASTSADVVNSGWIGRWLDQRPATVESAVLALELDDTLSMAMNGDRRKGLAFRDPKRLYEASRDAYYPALMNAVSRRPHSHEGATPEYLYQVMAETLSGAEAIFTQSRLRPSARTYPDSAFGNSMKTIASMIASDIPTRVYYVSMGSFDTHVGQEQRQQKLFTELNDAVMAFTADLKSSGRFSDTLLMTFSEFGRRVSENASGGTDHGTANNMFLIGGGLKRKGLLNGMPDLGNLSDGDLQYKVDFKRVYATVLERWLQSDPVTILGGKYEMMDFI